MATPTRIQEFSSNDNSIPLAGTLCQRAGMLLALVAASAGCSSGAVDCTANYVFGIKAVVASGAADDGTGGAGGHGGTSSSSECLATVVAVDGEYEEELECYAIGADCECYGAGERKGRYEVTATLEGGSETLSAVVTADECHVKTVTLNFFD